MNIEGSVTGEDRREEKGLINFTWGRGGIN